MAYYILKSYKLRLAPLEIFSVLSRERNCFFLDSSLNRDPSCARYSFLGMDPFFIFRTVKEDPFTRLRSALEGYRIPPGKNRPPFMGGAVGYFTYEADCLFGFYNTALIIDHFKSNLYIFSCGFPEKKTHWQKQLSESNFRKIERLLAKVLPEAGARIKNPPGAPCQLHSNFSKEGYLTAVQKAKEYIRQGDIYQVNLSQQFQGRSPCSAPDIYRRLRKINPSAFGAYFDAGAFQILSSSPERFLKLTGGLVTTRPMKGTRPRSRDRLKDRRLRQELLKSAKDRAELMMIVDLERNDLGRVCSYSSVRVHKLRELEEYSTVFQTTATITGQLHKDKDRFDLLRASFPGGSITGCPKIRAMQIIEELEPSRRCVYTGALGYLSFSGDMEFNILIRTLLKKEDKIYFGSGGGIVADSNPQEEYLETLVKAQAMIKAIHPKGHPFSQS